MQLKHIALVLISGLVLSGCSHVAPTPSPTPEQTPVETQQETEVMEETSELVDDSAMEEKGKVVSLVAEDFTFGVDEIKVKQGEKLTVSVTNMEGFHDFVITELDVNSGAIPEGETMEIVIPTDKPGTYEYFCSVGQHRKMGMKGTLIIE